MLQEVRVLPALPRTCAGSAIPAGSPSGNLNFLISLLLLFSSSPVMERKSKTREEHPRYIINHPQKIAMGKSWQIIQASSLGWGVQPVPTSRLLEMSVCRKSPTEKFRICYWCLFQFYYLPNIAKHVQDETGGANKSCCAHQKPSWV